MQSIEVSAKSLDEAKKAAAAKLGVSVSDVEATVLEETKGLFGKSTVRIRATASSPAPAPTAPPVAVPKAPAKRASAKAAAVVAAPEPVEEAAPAPEPEAAAADKGRGRKPRAGGRGGKAATEPGAAGEPVADGREEEAEVVATQEDAENLAELLRGLLASADLSVTITPTGVSGRYVNLRLDGKDVAFLVGKHGEVLNALQYLVNIIGNRKHTSGVRATLDGNDYRKRREDTLTQLATNIANQVKQRGEEAVLDALPAFERRIVHKALSTIEGITTYSEGEEPNRRVVIAPGD